MTRQMQRLQLQRWVRGSRVRPDPTGLVRIGLLSLSLWIGAGFKGYPAGLHGHGIDCSRCCCSVSQRQAGHRPTQGASPMRAYAAAAWARAASPTRSSRLGLLSAWQRPSQSQPGQHRAEPPLQAPFTSSRSRPGIPASRHSPRLPRPTSHGPRHRLPAGPRPQGADRRGGTRRPTDSDGLRAAPHGSLGPETKMPVPRRRSGPAPADAGGA